MHRFRGAAGPCTLTFEVTGGTGRFQGAKGVLKLTETTAPVLGDASGNPVFLRRRANLPERLSGKATRNHNAFGLWIANVQSEMGACMRRLSST